MSEKEENICQGRKEMYDRKMICMPGMFGL